MLSGIKIGTRRDYRYVSLHQNYLYKLAGVLDIHDDSSLSMQNSQCESIDIHTDNS